MNDARFSVLPAPPTPPQDPDVFDYGVVRDYLGFVFHSAWRHKVVFFSSFVVIMAMAALLAVVLPSKYQVEATVLAQRSSLMGTLSNPGVNRDGDAPTRAAKETVMSRDNLVALCRQTHFVARHRESRAPIALFREWLMTHISKKVPDEEAQLQSLVDAIQTRLWVNTGEGTVTINFNWSSPDLTYDYVDAALQSFLEARHAAEITAVGETIAILEAHDARVQKEASALAAQLEEKQAALRGKATPPRRMVTVTTPGAAPEPDDEQRHLETSFATKQRALADLEEFRRRRLDDMQAKLADQLHVYAPEHPLVVETRKSIESMAAASPQLEQLRAEVKDLEAELKRRNPGRPMPVVTTTAAPALDMPDLRLLDDPRLDYERTQLAALVRQHSNLLERIDAARVEIDTAEAAFKYRYSVIAPPQRPKGPTKPFGLILLVAGFLGGIIIAFFATTVADLRGGRVLERWQIERSLGLTILARIDR
jgi:uncharacterized protein involved in exopolysaccharide biosynthesis